MADHLYFQNPDFTVSPLRGEVAPGGEFEVTVRFHPTDSGEHVATCFVDVEGREERLPMVLRGQAVGPLAVFAYDALEIGDIFVGAVHQYEVELHNRGRFRASIGSSLRLPRRDARSPSSRARGRSRWENRNSSP